MKKLTLQLFALLAIGLSIQSCSNTKTYAEQLADEKEAISTFISKNNIKVISKEQFVAQKNTTAKDEYVLFMEDGVYMHIDEKGGDSFKDKNTILTRFLEVSIAEGDTTLTNFFDNTATDQFRYTKTLDSKGEVLTTYGQFFQDNNQKAYMLSSYGSKVPSGWLKALEYVGDDCKVKLIVPSKMGHSSALQYVKPFFYELQYKIY